MSIQYRKYREVASRTYDDVLGSVPGGDAAGLEEKVSILIRNLDVSCLYNRLPQGFLRLWKEFSSGDDDTGERLQILLLCSCLRDIEDSASRMHIPEEFHEALDEQLSRIAEGLNGSVRWKGLRDDHYLKDLAITRLKMLPCGPLLVENGSGLPRRTLARNAVRHFGDVSRVLLDSAFRLRPCLEIHAHTPMLGHFHPEGWVRAYKAIARLLAADASSLGLVGGSWFFDPALRDISPRLAYLRDIPSGGGAVFLHDGATPGDVGNALAKSQTRRRLHEQGLYHPRSFIMFWSRGKLVEWARRTA